MEDTQEKIISFLTDHAVAIGSVIMVIIVAGAGYGIFTTVQSSREMKAQEVFGPFERQYNEFRQSFMQAETANPAAPEAAGATPPKKASGVLEQDYGSVIEGFKSVLNDHAGSQAAKMSALYLSEIYSDYKNLPEAQKVLEEAEANSNDLVSVLVQHRLASVIADQGNCPDARTHWQRLISTSPVYLQNEMKFRMAGCLEKEGAVNEAKALYTELSAQSNATGADAAEASLSRDAEKYLRHMNFSKSAVQ